MTMQLESASRAGWWTIANRLVSAGVSLLVIPLAADRLDGPQLGVVLLLAGLLTIGVLADLGIPNAVVSPVSAAMDRHDELAAADVVDRALRMLTRTGALIGATGAVIGAVLVASGVVVPDGVSRGEMGVAVVVTALSMGLNVPAGLMTRVLLAAGRARVVAQAGLGASLYIVVTGVLAWLLDAPIAGFVLAVSLAGPVAGGICAVVLRRTTSLLDGRSSGRADSSMPIGGRAVLFLGIGIAGVVGFETDGYVIGAVLGADRVPAFLVPARVLLFVPALAVAYVWPQWPVISSAYARGDLLAIRALFERLLRRVAAAATCAAVVLGVLLQPVMEIATPSVPPPSLGLVVALVGLAVVHSVSAVFAVMLSGLDLLGVQLASAATMAVANIGASIVLADRIGLAGPAIATIVTQTLLTLVPMAYVLAWRLDGRRS
jgi:O-antigen/teichoic acid export membrane protein